jgi:hypothetical protein
MKWLGYGLQGVGGLMALAGMGVFAVGKLVEHAASREGAEELDVRGTVVVDELTAAH